ncbi:hypothetical protein D9757_014641 [Collybiopsis confluens]|uniref:Amine oxidase domain-containing protein n=1 Tax=Collybiopsis confluens TaxID=2823264 RepID=A0A8H5FNX4_9AGAR|nr:hypothetical protein D9757_014641 [Collybiopsis confluens]
MSSGADIPDIRSKVARYFTNKKLRELETINPKIKVDAAKFPYFLYRHSASDQQAGTTAIDPSLPSGPIFVPEDQAISWKDLYGLFQDDLTKTHGPGSRRLPTESAPLWYSVAIIGAGVAGLRIAKLLQDRKISYKIFEASTRPGGRVFTYDFASKPPSNPQGKHDYYDVGAMRFPDTAASQKTIALFEELGLGERVIPYVFSRENAIMYFNGIKSTALQTEGPGDHFKDETVPEIFLNKSHVDLSGKKIFGADACLYAAYDPFRAALVEDFDQGWEKLMAYDRSSVRSYLTHEAQYPIPVAHWLETRNSGTGGFDSSFAEAILESLEFNYPTGGVQWKCLDGGSEVFIDKMVEQLQSKPFYNQRVTSVKYIEREPGDGVPEMQIDYVDETTGNQRHEFYNHVVSTTTFAALSTIDTSEVQMSYIQRQAIRSLLYGAAIKVGIKFSSRWWEKTGINQRGASSYTDRLSRVVVYPSAGIGEDGPGVLMVTYNWNQDASRFGALIKNPDWSEQLDPDRERPRSEKQLLELLYKDLAALHGVSIDDLRRDTLDYHVFDWYHSPHTMGAYAHFGPGQYSTLWPDIVQSAGLGRFHFAGELASANHAWVAGALDSAERVVREIAYMDFLPTVPQLDGKYEGSSVFSDDQSAHKYYVKGLFGKEVEEAMSRKANF